MTALIHAEGDIVAAIDGSALSPAVAEAGVWVARKTGRPLTLLQAIERPEGANTGDLSGSLSLGSQDDLLSELASLDQQRSQLLQRQGRVVLEALASGLDAGAAGVRFAQRHGDLVDVLLEAEPQVRLFVLGRRGAGHASAVEHLGRNVERVIRSVQRPVLVVPETFHGVASALIAYDGSPTAQRCVAMVAESPLLKGLPATVLMVGGDPARAMQLDEAVARLTAAGIAARGLRLEAEVDACVLEQLAATGADLLVMGAYGHSRIRHLLVGSTTTALLRQSPVPVLLLR
ncbi:MAG: universal stress protein UspA [Silanimonas sp.]|nr:MAG: universal stress protein UspA [Silanimonas sp.]